jgi:hypothetical protein
MNSNTFLRIWNNKYKYDSNSSLRSIFRNKYLYKNIFLQTFLTVSRPFILGITGYAHLPPSSFPSSPSLKFTSNDSDGIKDVSGTQLHLWLTDQGTSLVQYVPVGFM